MNWKKISIIAGIVVVLAALVGFTVIHNQQGVVAVQIGTVQTQDLTSVVTASGEIKPKTYVNIGANAFGKIIKLYVKEGQQVKQGQMLAQLESVQSAADVAAQRASLGASRTDQQATIAAERTAVADLNRARADAAQKRLDWQRAQGLYKDALIAKADYDARQMAYESAEAGLAQAKAQTESASGHIQQAQAMLTRSNDQLSKTTYVAPFEGTVTNLPVHEGETVVVGIQNSPGSTLMTVADLSVITAEVRVDETDIVNVKLGQTVDVTIDALPNKTFHGTVSEIGDNALVRSTGVATTQTTGSSQEAKDFKVVVTVNDPPPNLRPGLSTTAKITTATRNNAVAIPIQALTVRQEKDLQADAGKKSGVVEAAPEMAKEKESKEIQGVFVVDNNKAKFVPVTTGITGVTDIEVLSGIKSGDKIVTGSYKVLRSLRNGARIKQEKIEVKKDEESS